MADKKSLFTKDKQPANRTPRGRGAKVVFLEMLREESQLELTEGSTVVDAEKAFMKHVWERASNDGDPSSGACLTLLANKCWPNIKAANDVVDFEFDETLKPLEQASQVLAAIASGDIPPDIGNSVISSIASMIKINEVTELSERIEKLEKALSGEA